MIREKATEIRNSCLKNSKQANFKKEWCYQPNKK